MSSGSDILKECKNAHTFLIIAVVVAVSAILSASYDREHALWEVFNSLTNYQRMADGPDLRETHIYELIPVYFVTRQTRLDDGWQGLLDAFTRDAAEKASKITFKVARAASITWDDASLPTFTPRELLCLPKRYRQSFCDKATDIPLSQAPIGEIRLGLVGEISWISNREHLFELIVREAFIKAIMRRKDPCNVEAYSIQLHSRWVQPLSADQGAFVTGRVELACTGNSPLVVEFKDSIAELSTVVDFLVGAYGSKEAGDAARVFKYQIGTDRFGMFAILGDDPPAPSRQNTAIWRSISGKNIADAKELIGNETQHNDDSLSIMEIPVSRIFLPVFCVLTIVALQLLLFINLEEAFNRQITGKLPNDDYPAWPVLYSNSFFAYLAIGSMAIAPLAVNILFIAESSNDSLAMDAFPWGCLVASGVIGWISMRVAAAFRESCGMAVWKAPAWLARKLRGL